jgi:hypothetical protein
MERPPGIPLHFLVAAALPARSIPPPYCGRAGEGEEAAR